MRLVLRVALLVMVSACASPQEAVLGGLAQKPRSAVAMQRYGANGQPERLAPSIRLNESYALPNEDVQGFLDGIHTALLARGLEVKQNDSDGQGTRLMTYASPDWAQRTTMTIEMVSFDKMMVSLTEFYPKGSPQNP